MTDTGRMIDDERARRDEERRLAEQDNRIVAAIGELAAAIHAGPLPAALLARYRTAVLDALQAARVGTCAVCGWATCAGWTLSLQGTGDLICNGCWELAIAESFRRGGWGGWNDAGDERRAA